MAKCPCRTNRPADFAQFTLAALKSFRHPGGGVPIFDGDSGGEYQNFTDTQRGVVHVFYENFSQKVPPPQLEILNSP